jgi:hypothetical protein
LLIKPCNWLNATNRCFGRIYLAGTRFLLTIKEIIV